MQKWTELNLWTIAQPDNKGIVYAIGETQQETWQLACFVLYQSYHPGMIEELKKKGFKAVRAEVVYYN